MFAVFHSMKSNFLKDHTVYVTEFGYSFVYGSLLIALQSEGSL